MKETAARPIKGWLDWAARNPVDVALDPNEPIKIEWTEDAAGTIAAINSEVNAAVCMRPDPDIGLIDRWDYPDCGSGDCEDIALEKRRRLVAAGIPRRVLRLAIVLLPNREGHCVLTVRTPSGALVLDNLSDAIRPIGETGYRFVQRERSFPPSGFTTDI